MKSPRPLLRGDGPARETRAARSAAPALSRFSAQVLADLARKTRFVDPDLAANWPVLAGPEIARLCRPGRLTGGREGRTLEVVVPHGAAAASVEFASETLRRRLNDYFGPNAIARIAVIQGPAPPKAPGGGLSRFRTGGSR
ncbi:MAG: DciA family protein [Pseudomonadota bacterium]